MNFLTGKVYHQMDAKNRIRIPAKFKSAFPAGEKLYFFQYNEGRIAIMPESVLSKKMSIFDDVDPGDEEQMNAMAALLSITEEVTEDVHGRTTLPKSVIAYAGLSGNVVTVGMGSFIEVWDQAAYEKDIGSKSMKSIISALYKNKQNKDNE